MLSNGCLLVIFAKFHFNNSVLFHCFRDVHRGVAQVARANAHMPFSTQVALPRKKIVQWM